MEDMNLDFISESVSIERINERIIENVNKTNDENSLYSYIKYFVENGIDLKLLKFDVKDKIRGLLLSRNEYFAKKLIELLYSNDDKFLLEIIEIKYLHPERYFLDFVLNLLIKLKKFDTIEAYLKSNYDLLIVSDVMDEMTIISKLIMSNSDLGFKNLRNLMEKNPNNHVIIGSDFRNATWLNYSNKKSIDDLIAIFNFCLVNYPQEKLNSMHYSPVRISSETIISICKNKNAGLCDEILQKLNQIDLDKIVSNGGDLFYINNLKKDIREIILNHKSKPYDLKSVLTMLTEQNHIFY
jgi:hypothetical protein